MVGLLAVFFLARGGTWWHCWRGCATAASRLPQKKHSRRAVRGPPSSLHRALTASPAPRLGQSRRSASGSIAPLPVEISRWHAGCLAGRYFRLLATRHFCAALASSGAKAFAASTMPREDAAARRARAKDRQRRTMPRGYRSPRCATIITGDYRSAYATHGDGRLMRATRVLRPQHFMPTAAVKPLIRSRSDSD